MDINLTIDGIRITDSLQQCLGTEDYKKGARKQGDVIAVNGELLTCDLAFRFSIDSDTYISWDFVDKSKRNKEARTAFVLQCIADKYK
jgi:hypothetical protein